MIAAIATVAQGRAAQQRRVGERGRGRPRLRRRAARRRERDVLRLYAAGLPLKVVADALGIAYSTARENIDRMRVKYVEVGRPAPTKVDLLRRAMEDGILPGLDGEGGDARR